MYVCMYEFARPAHFRQAFSLKIHVIFPLKAAVIAGSHISSCPPAYKALRIPVAFVMFFGTTAVRTISTLYIYTHQRHKRNSPQELRPPLPPCAPMPRFCLSLSNPIFAECAIMRNAPAPQKSNALFLSLRSRFMASTSLRKKPVHALLASHGMGRNLRRSSHLFKPGFCPQAILQNPLQRQAGNRSSPGFHHTPPPPGKLPAPVSQPLPPQPSGQYYETS